MPRLLIAVLSLAVVIALAAPLSAQTDAAPRPMMREWIYTRYAKEPNSKIIGEWMYFTEEMISGRKGIFNIATNDNSIYPDGNSVVSLGIYCTDNKTIIELGFHVTLGGDPSSSKTTIEYNIDNANVEKESWVYDKSTARSEQSIPLIRKLLTANQLTVRATSYNEGPLEAVFSLRGLPEAVAPVQAACGWK